MGDIEVANQLIAGVSQALAVVGNTTTLTILSDPIIDINNPGANPSVTSDIEPIEAFLYDFDERYMPGGSVNEGSLLAIIDVSTLTTDQKNSIAIGNFLESQGTTYTISNLNKIVVSGIIVTVIIQLGVV